MFKQLLSCQKLIFPKIRDFCLWKSKLSGIHLNISRQTALLLDTSFRGYDNILILVCLIFPLIASCSSDSDEKKNAKLAIYSPNGEPLSGGILGHPTCEAAFGNWFDRVDANHDGGIDKHEFVNDAYAQFTRMDIDHNGFLVSEELDRFRLTYRDKNYDGSDPSSGKKQKHGKKEDSDFTINQSSLIDPVMSADTNLDFKVSRDEFFIQMQKNFNELDTDHNLQLSKPEVLVLCKKKERD